MSMRAMKMKSRSKKDRAKRAATDEHGNVQYNDETKKTKAEENRAKMLARIFFWMFVGPACSAELFRLVGGFPPHAHRR